MKDDIWNTFPSAQRCCPPQAGLKWHFYCFSLRAGVGLRPAALGHWSRAFGWGNSCRLSESQQPSSVQLQYLLPLALRQPEQDPGLYLVELPLGGKGTSLGTQSGGVKWEDRRDRGKRLRSFGEWRARGKNRRKPGSLCLNNNGLLRWLRLLGQGQGSLAVFLLVAFSCLGSCVVRENTVSRSAVFYRWEGAGN